MKNIFILFLLLSSTVLIYATGYKIPDFETSLRLAQAHPQNTFFQYILGKHFEKQHNLKEALKQYTICQNLNPKPYYQSALLRISNQLYLSTNINQLPTIKKQSPHYRQNPKEKTAYSFYTQKKYAEAAKLYQKIVLQSPSTKIFLQLSRCYLYSEQPLEAKKVLKIGTPFLKNSVSALELEGDIEIKLGHFKKSLQSYQTALKFSASRKSVLFKKIAKSYRMQNNFTLAKQAIHKSLAIKSDLWNTYEAGKIQEAQEHWKQALNDYQKAKKFVKKSDSFGKNLLQKRTALCRFRYSLSLYQKGDSKSAAKILTDLVHSPSLDPTLAQKAKFWKKQADFRVSLNNIVQNGKKIFKKQKKI